MPMLLFWVAAIIIGQMIHRSAANRPEVDVSDHEVADCRAEPGAETEAEPKPGSTCADGYDWAYGSSHPGLNFWSCLGVEANDIRMLASLSSDAN